MIAALCPQPTPPLTPADYLKKILTARVYDVAVESALEPARALSASARQYGAAQARGPAAGVQLQAARRLQQDGATLSPEQLAQRRDLRVGRQPCPRRRAGRAQAGRARGGRDAGDHAAAQDRRGARARRRSAAARRQLFRRLRARARAAEAARPDLRAPLRRPRRDRRPGHDRDGDPAPAPGPARRGVRRHRRRRADLGRGQLHQGACGPRSR